MKKLIAILIITLLFLTACTQTPKQPPVVIEEDDTPPVVHNDTTPPVKGCTKELKICPDGTGVGRVGPNCEFAACSPPKDIPPTDTPNPLLKELPISSRSFDLGTAGLIPRNFPNPSNDDWNNLKENLPDYGELYGVHTGWNDHLTDGIPQVVNVAYELTKNTGTEPYIGIGFEPDSMTQDEADNYIKQNGDAFKQTAVNIAQKHHPDILILGVEINRYYEKSPTGFNDFVTLYKETYDAVKAVSPNTKISTNFQLDYMRGGGAISGRDHTEHWNIIDDFENKLDIATFTSYPYFDYNTPEDIPQGYFTDIEDHTNAPILITETGWPSEPIGNVDASEENQIEYLKVLLERTEQIELYGIVWVFPYDLNSGIAGGLFDSISMKENDGDNKNVWEYWQALQEL